MFKPNTQSNVPVSFQYAREALKNMADSKAKGESAEAQMVYAMHLALDEEQSFLAIMPGKDGDVGREAVRFDVSTLIRQPQPEREGKRDTQLISARYEALATDMFALTEATNALKQMISRALPIVEYIDDAIAALDDESAALALAALDMEEVTSSPLGKVKKVTCVTVPRFLLIPDVSVLDALTPKQVALEKTRDYDPIQLDGSAVNIAGKPAKVNGKGIRASLAQLRDMSEAFKQRGRYAPNYEQTRRKQEFNNGVSAITSYAATVLGTDEAPFTLNKNERLNLFVLATRIAAIFATDPLSEEERKMLDEREAQRKRSEEEAAKRNEEEKKQAA